MDNVRTKTPVVHLGQDHLGQQWYALGRSDDTLVVSEGHRRKGNHWEKGGPFYVTKTSIEVTSGPRVQITPFQPSSWKTYDCTPTFPNGALVTMNPGAQLAPRLHPTGYEQAVSQAEAAGATLYRRARPGNPVASVGQTAIELAREGLPGLPLRLLSRLRSVRAVGSEYLNIQFGWVPLVSDIRKMYELYRTLDKRLDQLVRDNGKGIRRRRSLGTTTSVTTPVITPEFNYPVLPSPSWGPNNSSGSYRSEFTVTQERTWFSARFRYYVPDIGSSQWTRRATRALYGANPTPELLWEVLPWSWLIDWFTNVGDVVSNMSSNAVDNLVADYAFVMRHLVETRVTTIVYAGAPAREYQFLGRHDDIPSFSVSQLVKTESKLRHAANPYGFGVSYNGLSPYQLSILAALGVSRSRF